MSVHKVHPVKICRPTLLSNIYRTRIDTAKHFFIFVKSIWKPDIWMWLNENPQNFMLLLSHARIEMLMSVHKVHPVKIVDPTIFQTSIEHEFTRRNTFLFLSNRSENQMSECDWMRILKISCWFCTCKIEMLMSVHKVHSVKMVVPRSFKHL